MPSMARSRWTGSGYMMNDNRASGGQLVEDDILTCWHCGKVLPKSKPEDLHLCRRGGHVICSDCKSTEMATGCLRINDLMHKELEAQERRRQFMKAVGSGMPQSSAVTRQE